MEDNELRQAIAAMESYKERVEALSRQVQVLRVSLEEVTMSADALKAFKNAKEGDEIMVPVGASSFITVTVTSNRNDGTGYIDANNAENAEALKKSAEALNEAQQALTTISNAVQQEYVNRQQAAQGIQ